MDEIAKVDNKGDDMTLMDRTNKEGS